MMLRNHHVKSGFRTHSPTWQYSTPFGEVPLSAARIQENRQLAREDKREGNALPCHGGEHAPSREHMSAATRRGIATTRSTSSIVEPFIYSKT